MLHFYLNGAPGRKLGTIRYGILSRKLRIQHSLRLPGPAHDQPKLAQIMKNGMSLKISCQFQSDIRTREQLCY